MAAAALWSMASFTQAEQVFPRRNAIVQAVEKAGPGVVNISTEQVVRSRSTPFYEFRDPSAEDMFQEFFGRFRHPRERTTTSLGSGVIIDPEGYVVTNEHVVRRASKIHLILSDGSKHEGRLLASDVESDLALIKIDADTPLPTVPIGRSNDLMIGETVVALGNPFGLESTVTVGVVSATDRSVMLREQEAYTGLVQTDAAINPGNSGGALVNIHGELIAINVAIYSRARGIGFAIPVDRVKQELAGLFNYRVIKKTYIGIQVEDLTQELIGSYGLPKTMGVVVTTVDKASPAERMKMLPGDVIQAVDGEKVCGAVPFLKHMLKKDAGQQVSLRVLRAGKTLDVKLSVGTVPKLSGPQIVRQRLGLTLQPMTADLARSFGLRAPSGLLVTDIEPDGPGKKAGLKRGDIILRVAQFNVNSLDRMAIVMEQLNQADVGLVIVRRGRIYRARIVIRTPGGPRGAR